ncbi:MAG: hypothetical protein KF789_14750 [Bdellovibrionaceae bacterium]|nr:hypothetical protein [Pseudobdellovibrionaceae bacterium]
MRVIKELPMKWTRWVLVAGLALSFTACGPVVQEEENPNPTLQGDYAGKYKSLLLALQGSLRQQQVWLSENEHVFLAEKVELARDHFPMSGLALELKFDDLSDQGRNFTFPESQSAVMIHRIQSWQICPLSMNLKTIEMKLGENEFQSSPSPNTAYVGMLNPFDYGAVSPQYQLDPEALVSRSQAQAVVSVLRLQGCRKSRQIIEYSVFSKATVEAVTQWQSALNGILGDLDRMRASRSGGQAVPPVSLQEVIEKLSAAYSRLP